MRNPTDQGGAARRRFLRAAAASGALGALAACGLAQPAPPPTPAPPTTLTVWNWIDESLGSIFTSFEQATPSIKVKAESYRFDVAHSRFMSALDSGTGAPDLFIGELSWLGQVLAHSGIADLAGPPFDGAQLRGSFSPWGWGFGASGGKQLALPWVMGIGVGWYRADVLEAAGMPSRPEDVQAAARGWDGWTALDEQLRRASSSGSALISETLPLFGPAAAQRGYGWVQDGKLVVRERGTPAAQLLASQRARDIPAELAGGDRGAGTVSGKVAGMVDASWNMFFLQRDYKTTAGKWRVVRAPGGDYAAGALFLMIPQQSPNIEQAWQLARYLAASTEGANVAFKATGALPAFTPAWQDPLYDKPVEFLGGQPAFRMLTEAAGGLPAGAASPYDSQIDRLVYQEASMVARTGKDPEQAMADAEADVRKRIPELAAS